MTRTLGRRTLRTALGAGLLALTLAACSDDGGGSGSGDGDGGGGLGGLIGGGGDTTDEGEALQDPFDTADEGTRPDTPADDFGENPDDIDDRPLPTFGGGGDEPLVPEDDDPIDDTPIGPVEGEAVLDRLQNDFVSENEFDVWVCATPQVPEFEAVGYLYVGNQGAIVLVPAAGDPVSAGFTTSEVAAGTVVNQYGPEIGETETITNFGFSGTERFEASSDQFGEIGCERFFVDETTTSGGGSSGVPVSASIENTVSASGELGDVWACQGPQLQADANLYAFLGGQGAFAPFFEGQDIAEPVVFDYAENPPGSLVLSYQNGEQETLGGITFASDAAFDATSSFDGPLSCELVPLTAKLASGRSAAMSGALARLEASTTNATPDVLVGALAGAVGKAMDETAAARF